MTLTVTQWLCLMIVMFYLGIALGGWLSGWRRYWQGVARGRAQMAWEIEQASGMHDPVCTCPGRCAYHIMRENVKENN